MTLYANNVAGTLAANIGPSDTLLLLGAGQGAAFPSPTLGDYFYVTLVHFTTGDVEVVKCTLRSVDTLTVERGRDGTTAIAFTANSVVEMRLTAIMMREVDYRPLRGTANGIASLDAAIRVPVAQMPTSVPIMDGANKILLANIPSTVALDSEVALKAPINAPVFTGPVIVDSGAFYVQAVAGDNARMYLRNEAGTPQGLLFWDRASDTIILRRFNAAGNVSEGEFSLAATTLSYNGNGIWDAGNFTPGSKVNRTGDTGMTGAFTTTGTLTGATLVASGNTVQGAGALILAAGGAAQSVTLRPNGPGSSSNQANLTTAGLFTAPDIQATSDRRLKKGIKDRTARSFLADQLRLHDWLWKAGGHAGTGVIAQEVALVAPEYVGNTNGVFSVDKAGLALEAIVGLASRVRDLEKLTTCPSTHKPSKTR